MWQSHVEIKGYSVAYLDRIAAFVVPYCWTSLKFTDLHMYSWNIMQQLLRMHMHEAWLMG